MGTLTDDVTRLHDEIGGLRRARGIFLENLDEGLAAIQSGVGMMRADFRKVHRQTAQQAQSDRKAFVAGLRKSVKNLQKTVAGLRRGFAADIEGAHRAWLGKRTGRANAPGPTSAVEG